MPLKTIFHPIECPRAVLSRVLRARHGLGLGLRTLALAILLVSLDTFSATALTDHQFGKQTPDRRVQISTNEPAMIPVTGLSNAPQAASPVYLPMIFRYGVVNPPPTVPTYYVDGTNGNDSYAGSINAPWRTIQHAIATISPGNAVVIRSGIYRMSSITFGPAGTGFEQRTTFMAAPGERVIITRSNDLAPVIYLQNFVRLDGLWMGGSPWDKTSGSAVFAGGGIGEGKQIVNCTIFGYTNGINIGSSENLLVQGNRFVHTGSGTHNHGIYLSGGYTAGSMSQHVIVDGNLFVKGEGYAIHGWHAPHSMIITRNFLANHYWGIVLGQEQAALATDHLVANNTIWKQNNFGSWLNGDYIHYLNNVHGPNMGIYSSDYSHNYLNKNAFFGSATGPKGNNPIMLSNSQVATQLGLSEQTIDNTIAALDQSFNRTIAQILADNTIEGNFATLKNIAVPSSSALYRTGENWQDTLSAINVGADAPAPVDEGVFWKAFRDRGLRDFNSSAAQIYPPAISNITATPASTSAVLTWTTNKSADSKVSYGLSTTYSNSTFSGTLSTSHSLTLSNLAACTSYHYRVRSRDSLYLETVSADRTFTTTGCP